VKPSKREALLTGGRCYLFLFLYSFPPHYLWQELCVARERRRKNGIRPTVLLIELFPGARAPVSSTWRDDRAVIGHRPSIRKLELISLLEYSPHQHSFILPARQQVSSLGCSCRMVLRRRFAQLCPYCWSGPCCGHLGRPHGLLQCQ
jgi:hypothetical protein